MRQEKRSIRERPRVLRRGGQEKKGQEVDSRFQSAIFYITYNDSEETNYVVYSL